MNPIESISISGFQVHKNLTIELDPGITTIVGPSDVGKSAVLRALKWAALNSLRGFDFLRWGSKQAKVILSMGRRIARVRSSVVNAYELEGVGTFAAVSGEVPNQVSSELRVSEDNFQGQFDSPFWISDSAGEVSRQLNRIVNLESIDRYLSGAASQVKKRSIEQDTYKADYEDAHAKFKSWDCVLQWSLQWNEVVASQIRFCNVQSRQLRLFKLIEELEVQNSLLVELEVPDLRVLEDLSASIKLIVQSASDLRKLMGAIESVVSSCEDLNNRILVAESEYKEKFGKECPLCGQLPQ